MLSVIHGFGFPRTVIVRKFWTLNENKPLKHSHRGNALSDYHGKHKLEVPCQSYQLYSALSEMVSQVKLNGMLKQETSKMLSATLFQRIARHFIMFFIFFYHLSFFWSYFSSLAHLVREKLHFKTRNPTFCRASWTGYEFACQTGWKCEKWYICLTVFAKNMPAVDSKTVAVARSALTTPLARRILPLPRKHVKGTSPAGGYVNTEHSSKLKQLNKHSQ